MKNLTKLSLVAASLVVAGNALAIEGSTLARDHDFVTIKGEVPLNCEILPRGSSAGNMIILDHLKEGTKGDFQANITCNSKLGATMKLTAGDGLKLEGDESKDHAVSYDAWWAVTGQSTQAEVSSGTGVSATEMVAGSKDLASAEGISTTFSLELTSTGLFAGNYSDQVWLDLDPK